MRIALLAVVVLAGCLSDDLTETSFGVLPGTPEIKFSRSTSGITSYGGVSYYQWNVVLATVDGCAGDTAASFEINTPVLGAPNAFPTGEIPIRAVQIPEVVPSAYATVGAASGVSGTITIDSVDTTTVRGSFDATITDGPITGSFIAVICP